MLRTVKVDATKGADRTFVSLPGATLQWVGVSGRTMLYTCSPCSMLYAPCSMPCALRPAPFAFLLLILVRPPTLKHVVQALLLQLFFAFSPETGSTCNVWSRLLQAALCPSSRTSMPDFSQSLFGGKPPVSVAYLGREREIR